jgi:formate dehydrogenase subunit delta
VLRDDLARMANQIALFFEPYPEAEALEGVRDHLEKFWDPAMRRELIAMDSQQDGAAASLHPLVRKSIATLREHAAH